MALFPPPQAHYQALANSLAATQEEVAQHQRHLKQLNTQLGHEQAQVSGRVIVCFSHLSVGHGFCMS